MKKQLSTFTMASLVLLLTAVSVCAQWLAEIPETEKRKERK